MPSRHTPFGSIAAENALHPIDLLPLRTPDPAHCPSSDQAGLHPWQTIALATILAYASGITLGLLPVMRSRGRGFLDALRIIWIGEIVSIGVMEIAMNAVDYGMGGMSAPSIFSWMFLRGLALAVPAGFLAAWPVNYWLVSRELKACH